MAGRRTERSSARTVLGTVAVGVYVPCLIALFAVWLTAKRHGIAFGELSRDPLATFRAPAHVGLLSNLGILGWAAAATSSLLTARVVWTARPRVARFLGLAGALTTVLLLDDFFMLHERVLPEQCHITQSVTYGFYVVTMAILAAHFRRTILEETDAPLLACALGWFALSLGVDQFSARNSPVIEDTPKLLGILTWAVYFVHASLRHLRPTPPPAAEPR